MIIIPDFTNIKHIDPPLSYIHDEADAVGAHSVRKGLSRCTSAKEEGWDMPLTEASYGLSEEKVLRGYAHDTDDSEALVQAASSPLELLLRALTSSDASLNRYFKLNQLKSSGDPKQTESSMRSGSINSSSEHNGRRRPEQQVPPHRHLSSLVRQQESVEQAIELMGGKQEKKQIFKATGKPIGEFPFDMRMLLLPIREILSEYLFDATKERAPTTVHGQTYINC